MLLNGASVVRPSGKQVLVFDVRAAFATLIEYQVSGRYPESILFYQHNPTRFEWEAKPFRRYELLVRFVGYSEMRTFAILET
jgi:hypothetical protein